MSVDTPKWLLPGKNRTGPAVAAIFDMIARHQCGALCSGSVPLLPAVLHPLADVRMEIPGATRTTVLCRSRRAAALLACRSDPPIGGVA